MDLTVKHCPGLMLSLALCHNMKSIICAVADSTYNTSRPNIETEYQLPRIFLFLSHFFFPHKLIL